VVHRAVEAHRGVVLVDALTRGTRFTMLLPIASDHDASRLGETPVYNAVPFEPHPDDSADATLPRLSGVAP
jgi:hypothetical protein